MERGNLIHDVLEAFYERLQSSAELVGAGESGWLSLVDTLLQEKLAAVDSVYGGVMRSLLELEERQLRERLIAFIELDSRRPSFRVELREHFMEVDVGALRVGLKVDRIDRLSDGGQLVIDYKTGRVRRSDWDPSRPPDLQLPLYATRFAEQPAGISFAQLSAHGIGYQGVGSGEHLPDGVGEPGSGRGKVGFRAPDTREVIDDWGALLAAWGRAIDELADEFAGGDFRVDPANVPPAAGQLAPLTRIFEVDWREPDA